jgi:tRNA (cytidine56-2'-O)-methyltransferase
MTALFVLRLGHRPTRDKRITTHVCLVARAFGAQGIYIAGVRDDSLRQTLEKIDGTWGGQFWVRHTTSPLSFIREWRRNGGKVVHLTMYGLPLRDKSGEISSLKGDVLIVVGGEKVPREYYRESDYNLSVGSQPHSEVAALALLLDRLTCGSWESVDFEGAKARIIPSEKGKNVQEFR